MKKEIVVIPTSLSVGTLFKFDDSDAVYEVKKAPKRIKDGDSVCTLCTFGDFECVMPHLLNCEDVYFVEIDDAQE